jgi:uncharacterized membrane protein YfhO
VLADTDYPGWRATIDGKRTPIVRANALLRSVPVPAGEQRIVLELASVGYRAGWLLAIAGILASVVAVVARRPGKTR